ncbi:hypothetical protein E2P81_ATG02511 [Venturia nashicola]|nr:hypothetical protein E2P81_ATG02511 [Venturia nashicola]
MWEKKMKFDERWEVRTALTLSPAVGPPNGDVAPSMLPAVRRAPSSGIRALLSLLVATSTAQRCGLGTFKNSPRPNVVGPCGSKGGVWYCGGSGSTVVQKQSQVTLRAGKADTIIQIDCNGSKTVIHCPAGSWTRYTVPSCKAAAGTVSNVVE